MADIWSKNAVEIHVGLYGMDAETLEKLIEENTDLSLADYLRTYDSYLTPDALDQSNSDDGFHYPFIGMYSEATCSLCAAAWNAEGQCITRICEFITSVYPFADGQTTWETISTDAAFECGFLKAMGGPSRLTINNLTVEKATGEDVYRIADLFSSVRTEVEAFEQFAVRQPYDKTPYFIIDARDPASVKIEPLESNVDLYHDQLPIHVGSGLLSGYNETTDMTYGTFDRENGTLELGTLVVQYLKVTGEHSYTPEMSADTAPSILRLHGNPE